MHVGEFEGESEEDGYCRSQEDFYKWFFKVEQVYQQKMDARDSTTLRLHIQEKQSLNLCSVFNKGLCNSEVRALWRKTKFAEALLKYRPHQKVCFEMILQGGEHFDGQWFLLDQLLNLEKEMLLCRSSSHVFLFSTLNKTCYLCI